MAAPGMGINVFTPPCKALAWFLEIAPQDAVCHYLNLPSFVESNLFSTFQIRTNERA